VDLLVAGPEPTEPAPSAEPARPAAAPVPPAAPAPVPAAVDPVPPVVPPPPGGGRPAPRPAEYGDLLRFGLRTARALAGVPGCLLQRLRGVVGG
jgi:hypothetical protein